MTSRRSVSAALITGAVILALAAGFLFRRRTVETDIFRLVQVWKWGKAAEIRLDADRDGMEDSRWFFDRWAIGFSSHDVPSEIFVDSTFRTGRFDVHVRLDCGETYLDCPKAYLFERDLDGDGVFEERASGDAAHQAYKAFEKDVQATLKRLHAALPSSE